MANYNNRGGDLETLQNLAYTGAHLLTFQLVRQVSPMSDRVNLKNETFYFLTLAPGAGSGGDRTYDFQNKINIKFSNVEILALSFALHSAAVGNVNAVAGYSKFAKSNETKTVSIGITNKSTKYGDQRQIAIFVSSGKTKHTFIVDPGTASAMAKQLEWSAEMATKMEFARITQSSSFQPSRQQTAQMPQTPQVMPQMDTQTRSGPAGLIQDFNNLVPNR